MPERTWITDDGAFDYGIPYPEDHRLHGTCLKRIDGTVRKLGPSRWSAYVSAFGGRHYETKRAAMKAVEEWVHQLHD